MARYQKEIPSLLNNDGLRCDPSDWLTGQDHHAWCNWRSSLLCTPQAEVANRVALGLEEPYFDKTHEKSTFMQEYLGLNTKRKR